MEDFNNESDQPTAENDDYQGLWLTTKLMTQLHVSSRIGVPLMILCMLLAFSLALLVLYLLLDFIESRTGDFYLLEEGNIPVLLPTFTAAVAIYLFARAIIEGHKAWRLLKVNETDDNALLEGTERLSKMFRWLTWWGCFYVASLVAEAIWKKF